MVEMPILNALIQQTQASRLPLHVPGHKQGRLLPSAFSNWLGAAAKLDLTELPGLDNLHNPSGCILSSQKLAAKYYRSDTCLYTVNGSTSGVMAAIMGTARAGEKVLFLNSFHQSAWRGLILADAMPAFLSEQMDIGCDTGVTINLERIRTCIREIDNLAAVYLTSPTYQGVIAPVEQIATVVHEAGLPLIVDEAHGAHLGILDDMPQHSVAAGADIVIHSAHKMLPALTQTSWIHCTGPRVQSEAISGAIRLLQTTSPSYLLLASLDAAQAWLHAPESKTITQQTFDALAPVRRIAEAGADGVVRDPFRHWIPTGSLLESQRIQTAFEQHGIFVEYADYLGVLSIFGIGVLPKDVERYLEVYHALQIETTRDSATDPLLDMLAHRTAPILELRPREVYERRARWTSIASSVGCIAAAPITPYPPGVPIIYPGQVVSRETCEMLDHLSRGRYELHGVSADGCIQVLDMN